MLSLARMQVAEVLFGPSLEDICTQCKVPQRTAAIIFMALANGAPDMAGAIVAISNRMSPCTPFSHGQTGLCIRK